MHLTETMICLSNMNAERGREKKQKIKIKKEILHLLVFFSFLKAENLNCIV
jgi:hypothetical protein